MISNIRTYSLEQLQDILAELNQPKFRAKQLHEWLHGKHALSYDEMLNIPKTLRSALSEHYPLFQPAVTDRQISKDGTRKYILQLHDGQQVETVGIPSDDGRLTVCFSTQVGCSMGCTFCATAKEGFTRNLLAEEIIDQLIVVQNDFQQRISNAVGMGQGEPFLNYDEVLLALRLMNDPDGFNIGARHITVSTCGIIPSIDRFSREPEQFTLAVSLHSAIQSKRDELMPHVKNQTLHQLKAALASYIQRTNRRVTFEHLLIQGVNDGSQDLKALVSFCSDLLCHVNLIMLNNIEQSPLKPSDSETAKRWMETLNQHHIEATVRRSRGADIAGACGQLKNIASRNRH